MTDTSSDQWSLEETNTAFLLGGLFVVALDAWYSEYTTALGMWEELQDRNLAIMKELAECYCNINYPQQLKAIETACGFEIPEPDCSEAGTWRECASDVIERYQAAEDCYREQFCFSLESRCDNEWTSIRESTAANATQQKWAADRRRQERLMGERVALLNSAKAATFQDSTPIGSLLNAAQGKANTLIGGASQGFNATAQAFSFTFSQLNDSFGFGGS